MIISTVKSYKICTLSVRRIKREGFGESLREVTDVEGLKQRTLDVLANHGRIYGIYKSKDLVGIYIFERIENYFVKQDNGKIILGDKEFDLEKFLLGEMTAAFKMTMEVVHDEMKASAAELEKAIRADLEDQIQLGQVAGVEWNENLLYRENVKREKGKGFNWIGYLGGFGIGLMIGNAISDDLPLMIGFGFMYAMLWGGSGIFVEDSAKIKTLSFVNPEAASESRGDRDATI